MRTKEEVIQYRNDMLVVRPLPIPDSEYTRRHAILQMLNWVVQVYEGNPNNNSSIEQQLNQSAAAFQFHYQDAVTRTPAGKDTEELMVLLAKLGVLSWVLAE